MVMTPTVISLLLDNLAMEGILAETFTDKGPLFKSKDIATFATQWGLVHMPSSPSTLSKIDTSSSTSRPSKIH